VVCKRGMRDKVLGIFLEGQMLIDDRALGCLLSQNDPEAASRRVLEGILRSGSPPLVIGMAEVHELLMGPGATRGSVVFVGTSTEGGPRMPVAELPGGMPGARALAPEAPSVPLPVLAPSPAPTMVMPATIAPRFAVPAAATSGGNGGNGSVAGLSVLMDITGNSTCSGTASDFARYFQDRFNRLRRLIAARQEMSGAMPIASIAHKTGAVKTIGMVSERNPTSKGGVIFGLEDASGTIKVLCMQGRAPTDIVTDEVVGVVGNVSPNHEVIYAEGIVRPEIPVRRTGHRADREVHVAFASDIHVGSTTFLDSQWDRFMDYLNGRLDSGNGNGVLDTLEYLIIPGDLVDGIGVYPNQRDELLITDIYRQYEAFAELLKDVPDDIEVILTPGNHDAVRQAEPQPAIPKEIQKSFTGKVRFLGNPALISIEGVRILAYHGRSIDDYVTSVQGCTYEQPIHTMKEMLRRRHLAPVYGGRTPIAPEASDHLVIETIPDIFVTGHVHGAGAEAYRGTLLINASAWQSQTRYQKSMNFVPDPAKVPIVSLKDMSVKIMDFGA